jgi:hypothetical protein
MYRNQALLFMAGGSAKGQPNALKGLLERSPGRYLKPEVAGDGIDLGCIERNSTPVDCGDQVPGAIIVIENPSWVEKTRRKASK